MLSILLVSVYMNRFVDGSGYFSSVADAIQRAEREIFIAGWWYALETVATVVSLVASLFFFLFFF